MLNILRNLDWSVLTGLLLRIIPVLICCTLHEYSHARVALALGDTTAKNVGRITLNPLKSFDIMGFIMMAFVGFGWAKPVPIDMRRFKHPKRDMAITAAAGPLANIVIAIAARLIFALIYPRFAANTVGTYVVYTVYWTARISVSFAVFNIIPIPPLDGSKVLFSIISDEAYMKLMRYERYGMILLFVIVFTGVIDTPLNWAVTFVFNTLLRFPAWY